MATTTKTLRTWTFGEYSIVKVRDEDGPTYDVFRNGQEESLGYDEFTDARAYVRDCQNTELYDQVQDLLAHLDLEAAATTKKLESIIKYLGK